MLDPETAEAVWLEKQPSFLERLFSSATGSGEVAVAPRDLFSRFAAKPEWMLARAVHDARQILTGSAIQARCLECPSTAMPLAPREKATLGAWLKGLVDRKSVVWGKRVSVRVNLGGSGS